MKKIIAITVLAAVMTTGAIAQEANRAPGGIVPGIIGCCFGLRAAADYNSGKDLTVREWFRLVPIVNYVVGIIDAMDGYKGVTRENLQRDPGPRYF